MTAKGLEPTTKRTLNHLAKLAKRLSYVVSTYMFRCITLKRVRDMIRACNLILIVCIFLNLFKIEVIYPLWACVQVFIYKSVTIFNNKNFILNSIIFIATLGNL